MCNPVNNAIMLALYKCVIAQSDWFFRLELQTTEKTPVKHVYVMESTSNKATEPISTSNHKNWNINVCSSTDVEVV